MAKKKKVKRTRSFKVHSDSFGIPFIRFGGKYLNRELGLSIGDRVELINNGDTLMLRKFSVEEVTQYETEKKHKALLKNLFPLIQHKQATPFMIAESREAYNIDDELIKQHEHFLQGFKH